MTFLYGYGKLLLRTPTVCKRETHDEESARCISYQSHMGCRCLTRQGGVCIKIYLNAIIGVIGAFFNAFLFKISPLMDVLLIEMLIDYITGCIVAVVSHNSPKSKNGGLSSTAGLLGLIKKAGMICLVYLTYLFEIRVGVGLAKDCVIFAYMANELLSIVENLGLIGVPIPDKIKNVIDILKERSNNQND